MNLSDNVIAHIAQLVQIAILTGTDVVDHLRRVELVEDSESGTLFLTEAYQSLADSNVAKMLEEIVGDESNEL